MSIAKASPCYRGSPMRDHAKAAISGRDRHRVSWSGLSPSAARGRRNRPPRPSLSVEMKCCCGWSSHSERPRPVGANSTETLQ
jgi:hypothetical protein